MTSGLYRITLVARRLTETRVEQASQRCKAGALTCMKAAGWAENLVHRSYARQYIRPVAGQFSARSLPRSDVAVTPLR